MPKCKRGRRFDAVEEMSQIGTDKWIGICHSCSAEWHVIVAQSHAMTAQLEDLKWRKQYPKDAPPVEEVMITQFRPISKIS